MPKSDPIVRALPTQSFSAAKLCSPIYHAVHGNICANFSASNSYDTLLTHSQEIVVIVVVVVVVVVVGVQCRLLQ